MNWFKFFKSKRAGSLAIAILALGIGSSIAQPPPSPPGAPIPPPPPAAQLPPSQPLPPPPPNTPPGWSAQGYLTSPPSAEWMNQGNLNVMATGYDTESVLVQIPLYVSYSFNGVNYDVTVINSWNPYSQMWNVGVDEPAYQTSYYFNGFNYNYYVNLPSGTFYFNR